MKVLIAYDGSSFANAAITDLRNAGLPEKSEALIVTVAHETWPGSLKEAGDCAKIGEVLFQTQFPDWKISSEALWGEPAEIIKKTVDHWKPDLLVVGSHGRSAAGRLLLGSVSVNLVHHAPCAVRVVRADTRKPGQNLRILIASDGSDQAKAAVEAVVRRNWPEGTKARVVSIVQTLVPPIPALVPALEGRTFATEPAYEIIEAADEKERARLRDAAEAHSENLRRAGLDVSVVVLDSNARTEITAEAERWNADTIFVGARGLGAFDRILLGSVSSAIVTHAHCSVEVVRQS
jgi:nucleotide-binding universal stress UspA family protein